ncbi:MAG TPA: hypothetical protein VJP81_09465 [Candidatus Dormibacteraeota bacterium]|nr:hypothetical protein [Candidatus Dormibacteraeota bacterium]
MLERLLGSVEVTHPQAQLTDLAIRRPCLLWVVARQFLTSRRDFAARAVPSAAQSKHLRPVHTADAGKAAGYRPTLAPARRSVGPFGGSLEVSEIVADRNRLAVDDAGGTC